MVLWELHGDGCFAVAHMVAVRPMCLGMPAKQWTAFIFQSSIISQLSLPRQSCDACLTGVPDDLSGRDCAAHVDTSCHSPVSHRLTLPLGL